jgi:hypothetical protein
VIDDAHVHASGMQIDAAIKSVLRTVELKRGLGWKMDAVEPANSAAALSCVPASPLGIANLNGNAASAGSGGHDEYPGAAADGGGM